MAGDIDVQRERFIQVCKYKLKYVSYARMLEVREVCNMAFESYKIGH